MPFVPLSESKENLINNSTMADGPYNFGGMSGRKPKIPTPTTTTVASSSAASLTEGMSANKPNNTPASASHVEQIPVSTAINTEPPKSVKISVGSLEDKKSNAPPPTPTASVTPNPIATSSSSNLDQPKPVTVASLAERMAAFKARNMPAQAPVAPAVPDGTTSNTSLNPVSNNSTSLVEKMAAHGAKPDPAPVAPVVADHTPVARSSNTDQLLIDFNDDNVMVVSSASSPPGFGASLKPMKFATTTANNNNNNVSNKDKEIPVDAKLSCELLSGESSNKVESSIQDQTITPGGDQLKIFPTVNLDNFDFKFCEKSPFPIPASNTTDNHQDSLLSTTTDTEEKSVQQQQQQQSMGCSSPVATAFNTVALRGDSSLTPGSLIRGSSSELIFAPSANEPDAIQLTEILSRWLVLINQTIERNKESIANPTNHTGEFFAAQMATVHEYKVRLNNLVENKKLPGDLFLLIAENIERLDNHNKELDRAKKELLDHNAAVVQQQALMSTKALEPPPGQITASPPSPPPPTVPPFQEELKDYDGDILNWPLFAATYLSKIRAIQDRGAQFRLLYNHLDAQTRTRFLSDIDPTSPDMELVFRRIRDNFEDPIQVFPQINISLFKLPRLMHRFDKVKWLQLMDAASKALVLARLHQFSRELEHTMVDMLLKKLPPKYRIMLDQQLANNSVPHSLFKLEQFVQLCDFEVSIILQREASGMATIEKDIPSELCKLCEMDYHYPTECEFDVKLRNERVKEKGLCRRCLAAPFGRGSSHRCTLTCGQCKKDHHLALCTAAVAPKDPSSK